MHARASAAFLEFAPFFNLQKQAAISDRLLAPCQQLCLAALLTAACGYLGPRLRRRRAPLPHRRRRPAAHLRLPQPPRRRGADIPARRRRRGLALGRLRPGGVPHPWPGHGRGAAGRHGAARAPVRPGRRPHPAQHPPPGRHHRHRLVPAGALRHRWQGVLCRRLRRCRRRPSLSPRRAPLHRPPPPQLPTTPPL